MSPPSRLRQRMVGDWNGTIALEEGHYASPTTNAVKFISGLSLLLSSSRIPAEWTSSGRRHRVRLSGGNPTGRRRMEEVHRELLRRAEEAVTESTRRQQRASELS